MTITLWHPVRCIGGMCHYMLPNCPRGTKKTERVSLDGRYAEDAMEMFMQHLIKSQTNPSEYEAKIFGGAKMYSNGNFQKYPDPLDVGRRNIDVGQHLLRTHGFEIKAKHIGGVGHRNLIFDISKGDVWVRHSSEIVSNTAVVKEGEM
ncbi:MAG: chemotaxis protein CheD [Pseudomonadales bacterium]|nr:chemotaxis protein CheD [Pseudomonadales bacterium]